MNTPTVSFKLINWIKKKSTDCVLLVLVIVYFSISILFGVGYYFLAKSNNFNTVESSVDQMDEQNSLEIKTHHEIRLYFIPSLSVSFPSYLIAENPVPSTKSVT